MVRRQNSLLHPDNVRLTPEFNHVLYFLKKYPDLETWPSHVHFASDTVPRLQSAQVDALRAALNAGEGQPVIITDATAGWEASNKWSLEHLKNVAGDLTVRVNDRAPARHADMLPGGGGPQQSVQLRLSEYLDYIEQLPASLDKFDTEKCSTPFYLNGWLAFSEIPALAQDCPDMPSFAAPVDDTLALLAAVDAQLFKAAPSTSESTSAWCNQVNANLRKVFISPPGCLTRLHYDAGDAHGWLAQVTGRKLFIMIPPSETKYLHPLASEIETKQSPIDPLKPDVGRWPEWRQCRPLVCILRPGEAVMIPKGWWHYAVALDRSITVQRNFYNATTNAEGLVQMVLKTAASLQQKGQQQQRA